MVSVYEPDTPLVKAFIDYPESDGEPIGETDVHIGAILYLRQALRYVFRREERIYVGANMLLLYEEGDPSAAKAPDVFVVRGVGKQDRRSYKLWEEGVVPCLILEISSKKTRLEDLGNKRALYEMLGVQEYGLFDPLGEYLTPRFQAFVLEQGRYREQKLGPDETFRSLGLGIVFQAIGTMLRPIDPETGQPVQTLEESYEERVLLAEQMRQQADQVRQQADQVRQQAERADGAEAEVARLRAELEALRRGSGPPTV